MKDTFISARLIGPKLIRVNVFSMVSFEKLDAYLIVNHKEKIKLIPTAVKSLQSNVLVDFALDKELPLGNSYILDCVDYGFAPLDVSEATTFEGFDEKYFYESELGIKYKKEETLFSLWAPLSSKVVLKIAKKGEDAYSLHQMKRGDHGVFSLTLKGDYDEAKYLFLVTNSECERECLDPYAYSGGPNMSYSSVIDFEKLIKPCPLEENIDLSSGIIYEANVRDMSMNKHSSIKNRGKFVGLIEKDAKTKKGLPVGLNYIKKLGVTHIQLMPIYDFATIDELNIEKKYNWGYDPCQYFIPEGGYCTDPYDSYKRVNECIEMINEIHRDGMAVSMDVVYNHVYEYVTSNFEKIVPNYFFRRRNNGKITNCSGCGNDFASEKPMVERFFVDVSKYWVKTFGIDCFRMDLMGLIKITVVKKIEEECKEINKSFRIYGEGWNMAGDTILEPATIENAAKCKDIGFFNDTFRESCKRFLAGDMGVFPLLRFAYCGSMFDMDGFKAKFDSQSQSINYVECHDDKTFFDYISDKSDISTKDKLMICKLAGAITLTSFGIPFIHAGQEIGASKFGKNNTYNLSDVYNQFPYDLLDERERMYRYYQGLNHYRRRFAPLYLLNKEKIAEIMDMDLINSLVVVKFKKDESISPYKRLILLFNPTNQTKTFSFDEDMTILFDGYDYVEEASSLVKNAVIGKYSVLFVGEK
ncbi:MAG: type I pullulanase [Bacilli bacterium]|nr:type I pullulanase [Bacilli bacterium]